MKYLQITLKAFFLSFALFYLFSSSNAQAIGRIFPQKKSGSNKQKHLGWLIIPFPMSVSGVGTTVIIAGGVTNIYKGLTIGGGLSLNKKVPIAAAAILNIPVLDKLKASVSAVGLSLSSFIYKRNNMAPNDLYQMQTSRTIGNVSLSYALWYDQIVLGLNAGYAKEQRKNFFDKDSKVLGDIVRDKATGASVSVSSSFNIVDNTRNPTKGVVATIAYAPPGTSSNSDLAKSAVLSENLSAYVPVFKHDVLVLNMFRSDAFVQSKGLLDEKELREKYGLQCDPASSSFEACSKGEDLRIHNLLGYNQYGSAVSLGGSSRLRSFPANRFVGAHSFYQAAEYRWNIPISSIFNLGFIGGSIQFMQLAFFAERGSVSDGHVTLLKNYDSSYGAGLRILISSFIYRLDVATGKEGGKVSLIAGYPMKLGSPF